MNRSRMLGCALMALTLAAGAAAAPAPGWTPQRHVTVSERPRHARPARSLIVDNLQRMDINNIGMFLTNTGSFAWDKTTGIAGLEFPNGTGKTAVFAAGLWLGAKVNGETTPRTEVSEYSDEYGPGTILNNPTPANPWGDPDSASKAVYHVYKLNRRYATPGEREAALTAYKTGAEPYGAPTVSYIVSSTGDTTLSILGDQMCWAVYNDADITLHRNAVGDSRPLGLEIQQTTFAFARQGALGNSVFISYKFINKGTQTLDQMYVSQWSDPDLGGATDDVEGCDVAKSLGFIYNSTNADQQYGSNVPSVGYKFFQGPKVSGTPLGMTSFDIYLNAAGPADSSQTYNDMSGLNEDGSPIINPVTGQVTTYKVSGDPVLGTGWLDGTPADHRLMLSSGPFTMAPGDTQVVVTAIVIGQSKNRLASISLMKFYAEQAQSAFDQNFNLPSPPDAPRVAGTSLDAGAQLTWDTHAESYDQLPYKFEGYAVYQGASTAGPFTRVATFDVKNGITVVLDDAFDEESGVVLPKVAAQGNDGGLRYVIQFSQDAVRGGPLRNGTPYYYVVTAYSVALGSVPQVLESPFSLNFVTTVIPQTPPGGVDWASAQVDSGAAYARYDPAFGPTTDSLKIYIITPDSVLSARYRVGYKPNAAGIPMWYVVRYTAAGTDTMVNNQLNYAGDGALPIFDGIQVKVIGADYKKLLSAEYLDVPPNPPGLVPDPGNGLPFWIIPGSDPPSGGVDYSFNYFGSALDPSDVTKFSSVEIRFTGGPAGQKAYRYLRTRDALGNRIYYFQDYVDVPFTVWDIDQNRQINVGFLENTGYADGMWDPDPLPDFSGPPGDDREFIQVFASSYSATADPLYTTTYPDWLNDAGSLDLQYIMWPNGSTSPLTIDSGDKFRFQLASRSVNDYSDFRTHPANRNNVTLAQNEMSRILAVPNPYLNHSVWELDAFHRQLKFTHLPTQCSIRIYNLAGDLVRTLQKNDNTSQATWDLETDGGLPIGSGIYIFRVEAPGIGTHVGKVAVFMEKERLNSF
ncbi:MAG: hypothetical protein HYR73_07730 [Candidatus Eisenbacteria bacterium]|nr:hypothetical protein [Candidatus Eisenbacteria bacterium]